jgi:hypothetical protein
MVRTWLKQGKRGVWSWSIPPVITCPGSTETCEKTCRALRGPLSEKVRQRLVDNYALASDPSFAKVIEAEITEHQIGTVRVHVTGDFFAYCYTEQWLRITRACPRTQFTAFTRSWRIPTVRPVLDELAIRRNVRLWLSADRETGVPPDIAGALVAWTVADDRDPIPPQADRIYRTPGLTVRPSYEPLEIQQDSYQHF